MAKPLSGVRVLDLTAFLSGPYATQLLGGLGAEVIRVETPGVGAGERSSNPFVGPKGLKKYRESDEDLSMLTLRRCRNKKSITLNLKSEEGKKIFYELVKKSDVVVENFRIGVTKRLGIDYDALKEINPQIIYCGISGYGGIKAYEKNAALDITMQAFSGFMSTNGEKNGAPLRSGAISMADMNAAMYAASGVLAALYAKATTGVGQQVSVNMLEPMLNYLLDEPMGYYISHGQPARDGSRLRRATPFSNFVAKDGDYVLAANTDALWEKLLNAMDRTDLIGDERYAKMGDRAERTYEIDDIINAWSKDMTIEEVITALNNAGVPCAKVRTIPEVLEDENLLSAGVLKPMVHQSLGELPDFMVYENPIHFSSGETPFDVPAPFLGQHNKEIYGGLLSLDDDELNKLHEAGVI